MYMQNEIVLAAGCGPHFDPPRIDPVQRQDELTAILACANEMKAGLKNLGAFSLAEAREDMAYGYFAQVRTTRKRVKEAFEFRFPVPAQDTGKQNVVATAERLIEAARLFAGMRSLKPYHDCIRKAVDSIVRSATGGLTPMRVVALGLTPTFDDGLGLTIDVEMLGHDLRLGIDRVTERDSVRLDGRLKELVARHCARQKLRSHALACRATGWIDDAATRLLQAASIPVAEAVTRMGGQQHLEFHFGGEDGWASAGTVFWEEGVVRAQVGQMGHREWKLTGEQLSVEVSGLPQAALEALPGRRVRDLLEHALIPGDALITGAFSSGTWVWLDLAIGSSPIDDRMGLARPCARSA